MFLFPSCPFLSFPTAAKGPQFREKVIQTGLKGATYLSYLGMSSNQKLGNEIEFSTQIPLESQSFWGWHVLLLFRWALNVRIKGFQAEDDGIHIRWTRAEIDILPWKNAGWQTFFSFWNGPFSGDMLIFGVVLPGSLPWKFAESKRKGLSSNIYYGAMLNFGGVPT